MLDKQLLQIDERKLCSVDIDFFPQKFFFVHYVVNLEKAPPLPKQTVVFRQTPPPPLKHTM